MTKQKKNNLEQRKNALDGALKQITKQFGKGSIMRMSDRPLKVSTFSSGSLAIDRALGGGFPSGRISEIYGLESAGKTTLALEAVAQVQKQGGTVAYIDAENALDPDYAKALGVDIDSLLLSQPDTGEQGLEIANALVKSSAVDLIVVDSVAALVPRQEIEGEMGDNHVGLQARMMSQALRSFSGELSRTNTAMIFINQIREKVGVMFGNPETTPGGRALKFYSSVRLEIRPGKKIKKGTDIIGRQGKIKVVKNKIAPPFKRCVVNIIFGHGVDRIGELIDMASKKGIIDKAGSWYSYNNKKLGQGEINAEEYIAKHPNLATVVSYKVHKAYKIPVPKPLQDAMDKIKKPADDSKKSSQSAKSKSKKQSASKDKK